MITIDYKKNKEQNFELVERKGRGHPDTICDAIAEYCSRYYSQYFYNKYGKYAHHWFDKVMLIGGQSEINYGNGKLTIPYKVIVAGKCVRTFMGENVPLIDIFTKAAVIVLNSVLYDFDKKRDLIVIDETVDFQGSSREKGRYRPAELKNLIDPNSKDKISNDCNILCSYGPFSNLEKIVLQVEKHFSDPTYRKKHPEIGSDIKLVGIRNYDKYKLLCNIPFIADFIDNYEKYANLSKEIVHEITMMIQDLYNIDCEVVFNPSDRENKPYLTSKGSAADTGDVGVVGRGNRINGLISPMKCMSIEAPSGKNPIDHTGKLYGLLAKRIVERIISRLDVSVEVWVYVCKSTPIDSPDEIMVNIYNDKLSVDEENKIRESIKDELSNIYQYSNDFIFSDIELW